MELAADTTGSLPPGEGRILTVDGKRVGAYKDTDGTVYTVNPICSHMGCVLEWNRDENSWDCPCHGSRYDYTGRLLSGPGPFSRWKPTRPNSGFPKPAAWHAALRIYYGRKYREGNASWR